MMYGRLGFAGLAAAAAMLLPFGSITSDPGPRAPRRRRVSGGRAPLASDMPASWFTPIPDHNGSREMARRLLQIQRGQLKVTA